MDGSALAGTRLTYGGANSQKSARIRTTGDFIQGPFEGLMMIREVWTHSYSHRAGEMTR